MSKDGCYERFPQAEVLESVTLNECKNDPGAVIGNSGPLVAKVPVVIAEPVIQVDVESAIRLEEPALEIKRIKKNVYLTQCKLLDTFGPKSGKLFISGFVRKNIEYATASCQSARNGVISGDIRHTTARIPFQCVTKVDYINPPEFCDKNFTKEIEIYTDKLLGCDPCAQNIMGRNPCEQDFIHYECFSEKVFCELVDVKIFEEDIHQNPDSLGCEFPNEQLFQEFIEKMVLFIRVKVLQYQQVFVPKPCTCYDKKCITVYPKASKEVKDVKDIKEPKDPKLGRKWISKNGEWRPCD